MMAKRQTRRSVSVNGKVYDEFKAFCDRKGRPIAAEVQAFMEREVAEEQRRALQRFQEARTAG